MSETYVLLEHDPNDPRVVGPFPSREEAEEAKRKLEAALAYKYGVTRLLPMEDVAP